MSEQETQPMSVEEAVRILRQAGWRVRPPRPDKPRDPALVKRDAEIVERLARGQRALDIANLYRLTEGMIYKINRDAKRRLAGPTESSPN
jgi:hypothetical protein